MKTTMLFWDCECEKKFIHFKQSEPVCPVCKTHHEHAPDSRSNEINRKTISTISLKFVKERIKELRAMLRTSYRTAESTELFMLEGVKL